MNKKILIFVFTFVVLVAGIEIYLRFYWGFCDTVLMQKDNKMEYIAQPEQDRHRFRHHIYYNKYSMRSAEIAPNLLTILGFGDSVINGGVLTDQDSIATTLMNNISKSVNWIGGGQILNISAGSWGPDNCFAYLQKYGDFDAKLIFLVVSSHDAYDTMDFQEIIDVHPSFPSKQSFSAIYELVSRYLIPHIKKKKIQGDHITKGNTFNSGFINFYEYTKIKNIPFFIYLHPDRNEVKDGHYDEQGNEIIKFCFEHNILLIKGIEKEDLSCFRDGIHLNEYGQKILANVLWKEIEKQLNK